MESSRRIEERASEWLLRRESKDWSAADQARLQQWLDASVLNRVAFLRLEAGWQQVNRIKALGAGFPLSSLPGVAEPAAVRKSSGHDRRRLLSIAAGVMILLAGGAMALVGPWGGKRYATPVGGVSSVPLSDGSSVTLNTASRIRVRMSDAERRIELTQGEAFFDVAADPARPFVVQAGARRIVALGTKFSVRLDDDDVRIVVTEGMVGVGRAGEGSKEISRLGAGAVATAFPAAIDTRIRGLAESEELLSWRFGYLVFHETTLSDAVAEFRRYDPRDIVVRDPQIAAIRLTGKFRANNLDAFVRLLESTSPVRAEHSPHRIVLTSVSAAARQP